MSRSFNRSAQQTEIWDLYNERRELTGREQIRGEEIPEGYYHLVVHVWIRNCKGEYLISQRSADRPMHPLMWECVGGSVLKGETSLEGALRETREEVGLHLSPEKGTLVNSTVGRVIDGVRFSDIVDVWLFEYDGDVDLSHATTKEVAQTLWMTNRQIRELYDKGLFVHTLGYFFQDNAFFRET
jgi:8-oxo-dGTP pyrophosphatase MutT (NUDIX family)